MDDGGVNMAKSEMLHARIDAELKEKAESIFAQLGITTSEAIKIFYKQVELNGGLPFALKIPDKVQAQTQLLAQLKEAEDAVADGKGWLSAEESRKRLGL